MFSACRLFLHNVQILTKFVSILDQFGLQQSTKIRKQRIQKTISCLLRCFNQFWMSFGSILGAQGRSNGPLFSWKNWFCGSSGGQDGTRGLQGTPKLPKWSSKAPKMEPQRSPGLSKGSPGDPQTSQKWSQNASEKSWNVYPTKVRNPPKSSCHNAPNLMQNWASSLSKWVPKTARAAKTMHRTASDPKNVYPPKIRNQSGTPCPHALPQRA